jgi:UDPglucose 6-dehydrogenase
LLYEPFVRQGNPIMVMDERSSEMTKYAANAFLATKITFMNEIANLCERVGANVDQIRRGIGSDSRIGKHFLYAGIGFGGSCFPKDVQALAQTSEEHGYQFRILRSVLEVNDSQRGLLVEKVKDYFGGSLEGRRIALWGLAFKPNTDDVREAPSHVIIRALLEEGADVAAFDPEAVETTRALLGNDLSYAEDIYDAVTNADALIIATEWNEFRRPDFAKVKSLLKQPLIFDGRNLYETDRMAELGFEYISIGRPRLSLSHDSRVAGNGADGHEKRM